MKKTSVIFGMLLSLVCLVFSFSLAAQINDSDYIINKDNGRIILAYRLFENFLNSDKSRDSYNKLVLEASPEMRIAHQTQISWGTIDTASFPSEVEKYKKGDWEKYFGLYDRNTLGYLYDTLISRADKVLEPINPKQVDLCLFLPYGGCWIDAGKERNTIFISLLIDPAEVPKIMIHEYSHNLHIQRRPEEPFSLKREVVSEGMAVYLTTLVLGDPGLTRSIPFMPGSSVRWCFDHEQQIKDSIKADLGDTTFNSLKKYIADGDIATPPKGFVEKTAYFTGYRIIEACIKKGMRLQDICALSSDSVIAASGYFR